MFPPLPNVDLKSIAPKFGDQDLVRRSASSVPAPTRQLTPMAKLIDVSKCIAARHASRRALNGTT